MNKDDERCTMVYKDVGRCLFVDFAPARHRIFVYVITPHNY